LDYAVNCAGDAPIRFGPDFSPPVN
jgi:hypothetical protein